MRCARCNRTLNTAYLTIGASHFGPKCAEVMGLSTTKKTKKRVYVQIFGRWVPRMIDPNQLALELTA